MGISTGKKLYQDENGIYTLELWGASTKHPDSVWKMSDFKMASWVDTNDPEQVKGQIFQWLLYVASCLSFPPHAVDLAKWAIDNSCVWED